MSIRKSYVKQSVAQMDQQDYEEGMLSQNRRRSLSPRSRKSIPASSARKSIRDNARLQRQYETDQRLNNRNGTVMYREVPA